jgi:hypothetical protein
MNNTDEISQKEKREILKNDRNVMGTYHALAAASANDLAGGRFAQSTNKQTVIGSSPVSYPAQPSSSPWSRDPVPAEMPLGWSVETIEPVGELWEQEKSREPLSSVKAEPLPDDAAAPTPVPPIAGVGASKFRRRI